MKSLIRKSALKFKPFFVFIFSLFFEKKYLKGKHFDNSFYGLKCGIRAIWTRNILRISRPYPFPVVLGCHISNPEKINFHPDDLNNFQSPGTYFQNFSAEITLGKGVYIGPNVGLITANHNLKDPDLHEPGKPIVLKEKCWIGMNAVILPGVILGPRTIVAAGAVVANSFPKGGVMIGGVPAKVIKEV
ncbi:Capsular polysaccharide synthesis enzyme [Alloalcanivorax dieselolei B5]|uniref:Capsular polysaccharide synthesis enzyme n=1 Tax=Alcanivorax dieselolei (strain DSM 16502 / CGMCC 1.3690 / MCCC 1A00001 / B-5) TaxID=930169 RepID=K0CEG4_ALCDB|nr:capsular polysaccharide biosynthesis protein [Alloalcanivorax dieselolei]AFT69991.1 Capsular polysaccharide synthesis enzyme [Alloalcanivorax dieselolei B5]GGJ88469.1 hypothetical protein GCM10007426_17230 [Alloalcanivorax dieselolei]